MIAINEYRAAVAGYRSEFGDEIGLLDLEDDNLGSVGIKTEFESVDRHGYASLITIKTTIGDYCQDALYRIEKGDEDREEFLEWWLDWGARRHALEVELADAINRGEITLDDANDLDALDFEVRVGKLEALIIEQVN